MLRFALCFVVLAATTFASDLGSDIARRHSERWGGRARALQSLYAEGRTLVGDEIIDFKLWAARPGQLRLESTSPQRRVTQIFNGTHEPLIANSEVEGGRPLRMSPSERTDFITNADFDGPLVDFELKGYTVDYAGEDQVLGRPASKLLLMSARDDIFFLWVDNETAEIVRRSVFRIAREQRVMVETVFSEFREIDGTLQPQRIETKVGDKTLYVMVFSNMEVNSPRVKAERFAVPEAWPRLSVGYPLTAAPNPAARQP